MKTTDQLDPTVFVIFGGAGDLTWRKLIPALFDLSQDRSLPAQFAIIAVDRMKLGDDALRRRLREGVNQFSRFGKAKIAAWKQFAPHLARRGAGNSGWCSEIGGHRLLHAERGDTHLVMGCSGGFARRSVGYVGASDGWQDVMNHFKMDWEFRAAGPGNLALTGEIDLQNGAEFTVAIALGQSCQSTVAELLQSLAEPFEIHRATYVRQWQRTVVKPEFDFSAHAWDGGHVYRLSRCLLLAHEDKMYQGALVASMSIPWGETKSDEDLGGYHLVCPEGAVIEFTFFWRETQRWLGRNYSVAVSGAK